MNKSRLLRKIKSKNSSTRLSLVVSILMSVMKREIEMITSETMHEYYIRPHFNYFREKSAI